LEQGFAVELEPDGDGWRIGLSGDIDVAADGPVRAALGHALARTGSHVVIDLGATTFLDSTAINNLVLAHKAAQAACLKQTAAAPATAKATSQQRMAACAAQNKGKKGADYKAAQSACLKKS